MNWRSAMWQAASWARRSPEELDPAGARSSPGSRRGSRCARPCRRGGAAGCARLPGRISVESEALEPATAAADIGVVADRGCEGQTLAPVEDRLEDEDVGQVHAAVERVVHHVDVAGMDVVAIVAQHRFDGGGHGAEMARQGEALRDQAPVAVGERRGEIHVVAQDARIGGAADGERHLVRDGEDGVPEELEAEGIGPRPRPAPPRPRSPLLRSRRALRLLPCAPPPFSRDDSEGGERESTLAGDRSDYRARRGTPEDRRSDCPEGWRRCAPVKKRKDSRWTTFPASHYSNLVIAVSARRRRLPCRPGRSWRRTCRRQRSDLRTDY